MAACSVPVSSPLQQIGAPSAGAEKHAARQSAGTCAARFPGSSWIGRSVGAVSSKSGGLERWARVEAARRRGGVRAQAGEGSLQPSERWGDGVSLGTALLPPDVDLGRLESLLFQWGNSLTANANLPLPTSLKGHIHHRSSLLHSPGIASLLTFSRLECKTKILHSRHTRLNPVGQVMLPESAAPQFDVKWVLSTAHLQVDKVKGGVRLGYIRINEGAIEDLVHIDVIVNAAQGDQKAYFQATRNGQFKDKVPPGEPLIMQSLLQALRKSIQIARE